MSNLSRFRKSTVAVLTALMLIAIAMPLLSVATAAGAPTASLGTTSGPNGTLVKVSGTGFGVNEGVASLSITVDGLAGKAITTTSATPSAVIDSAYRLNTDANGVLTGYFIIFGLSPGSHTVIVSDSSTSVVAGTFTITKPTVTITPSSVAAGTSVTVSASGYPTTNATIETTYDNKIVSANFSGNTVTIGAGKYSSTSDPFTLSSNKIATNFLTGAYLGTVSATVSLPAVTAQYGPVFNMTDAWNNVGGATLSLTTPTVTLSPSSGPVGTDVTVTLSGFGPTATIVDVTVGNNASASGAKFTDATVTEQGTAVLVFETPKGNDHSQAGVAGAQTVRVVDSLGNVGTATFTITPKVDLALGASGVSSGTTFAPASTASAQAFVAISGFKAKAELTISASPGVPTAWKQVSAASVVTGSYSATTQKVSTDANGVAVFTTDAATTPAAAGQYSITISDGTNSISTIVTITTSGNIIATSPSSGARGSTVTVTYFGTTAPAAITFDGNAVTNGPLPAAQAWPLVSTNTVDFTVGAAATGLHTIAAGITFNSVPFTVIASSITIVNPASASVGTTVTVVGTGFGIDAALLSIQGASVTAATHSLVCDVLIVTFVVPNYIPGSYTLSLTDGVSTATTSFSVASPSVQITPTKGTLGPMTTIALTGSGFKAGESITVTFDNTAITAGRATGLTVINTNGGMLINSGFNIPLSASAGAHTVTVMGASGAYATATFTVTPQLAGLAAVRPGAQIQIQGTGFAANSLQTLTVNGTATTWLNVGTTPATALSAGTSVQTTQTGDLFTGVPVGFVVSSTETSSALNITVTDASGNSASTILTILNTPAIKIGAPNVIAGTPIGMGVSINGTGFTPSSLRSPVDTAPVSAVLYQGSSIVSSVTLSAASVSVKDTGSFTGLSFVVPASVTAGTYTLQLTIGSAGVSTPVETASITVTVLGAPQIQAPASAVSGSNVTITVTGLTAITGADFSSSHLVVAGVVQQVSNVDQFGPITVSNKGANAYTATTWFIVPSGIFAGSYLLTLTDSNTGLTAQAAIQVAPAITVNPTVGSKGALVTVTGTGFAANSALTAKVNGAAVVLSTLRSDATGALSTNPATTFTIPVTAVATNTLTITDAAGNIATATFNVTAPVVQITPTEAAAGSTVQIIGSGFTVNSPIVVQVDGQVVTTVPAQLAANAGGSFITYITVPAVSGEVSVTATDNSNNVGTATLTVGGSTGTGVPNQSVMTSTAQTTTPSGTATTTFTAGSTVKASFMLQSASGSRDVVVAVTWQQGAKVYNMASFQTTMTTTATLVSFSNLLPAGVTGTWTATLQIFAADGVTPLGVTTLTFTVA